MNLRKFDSKKDKNFFLECIHAYDYKKFISNSNNENNYDFDNIYLVEDNNENNYGFIELTDIDINNNNLNLNIYMKNKKSLINILAIFESVRYIFKELMFHKIMIKVKSNNVNMLNILNRLGINRDGVIKNIYYIDKFTDVYIYSILDWEYNLLKAKFNERMQIK